MELDLVAELALVGRTVDGRGDVGSKLAVAAGELAELSMLGRVAVDYQLATVLDPAPTERPDLDHVLGWMLWHGKPMRLNRFLRERVRYDDWRMHQLTEDGLFAAERRKVLGLFPIWCYFPHTEAQREVLTRLWHLLRGWREPDRRTMALAGIVWGSGIGRHLALDRDDRRVLRAIGKQDPLGRAVRGILDAQAAAAI